MLRLGDKNISALYAGAEKIRMAYVGEDLVFGKKTGGSGVELPAGYTELEYVTADGNQVIDNNIIPTANTEIDMDIEVSSDGESFPTLLYSVIYVGGTYYFFVRGSARWLVRSILMLIWGSTKELGLMLRRISPKTQSTT